MTRKAIPKRLRQAVYDKYNGRCAYCGCKLEYKEMQVDHIKAVYVSENEDNSIENLMPACRMCNFYKSSFELEKFRERITNVLYENIKKTFNYRFLLKYGLIEEKTKLIKFYFEEVEE